MGEFPRYVRITINNHPTGYIQRVDNKKDLMSIIDAEFDDIAWMSVGDFVKIEVVEDMPDEQYEAMPEFQGW